MPQAQPIEQEPEQGLVPVGNKAIIEAFSKDGGLDPIIEQARQVVDGFVHDLSTDAGRKKSASIAHKVSKLKVRLDNMGKDLTAESEKKIKVIRGSRKAMREALDAIRDEARKPLNDWEAAEERRGQKHRLNLAGIRSLAVIIRPDSGEKITLAEMEENITELKEIFIDESWEEFHSEAIGAKEASMFALSAAIKETKEQITKDAELARLKKEEIERKKQEYEDDLRNKAAEKARLKAEEVAEKARVKAKKVAADKAAKIENDRQAALRREKETKARLVRAEQQKEAADRLVKLNAERDKKERIEAEKQREIDAKKAEKDRIAAKEKAKEDEAVAVEKAKQDQIDLQKQKEADQKAHQKRIEANKKHVSKIRREAKESLIALGIDEMTAKTIVLAIHNAEVKNIMIHY